MLKTIIYLQIFSFLNCIITPLLIYSFLYKKIPYSEFFLSSYELKSINNTNFFITSIKLNQLYLLLINT